MKILLIHPDAERTAALERELGHSAEVTSTQDGLYALTMIERNRPDLILISDRTRGLEPKEIISIVRGDPSMSSVRVGMLSSSGETGFVDTDEVDLMLPDGLSAQEMVERIRRLPADGSSRWRLLANRGDDEAEAQDQAADSSEETLSGSLSILNLLDLAQVLAHAQKSGRLAFDFSGVEAEVYLSEGQVVHATAAGLTGIAAFAEVLRQGELSRPASFRFEPLQRTELFGIPRTINMTVQQLLLLIAIDSDETDPRHREVSR